ncbi:hypothetical protein [Flavobacterium sp. 3-210]
MKFFDQPNPIEFLSSNDPPGYNKVAITIKIMEMTKHIKTECF